MKAEGAIKISAITVLYNPDVPLLELQLAALVDQVDCIVLVDNGGVSESAFYRLNEVGVPIHYLKNKENVGVASAINLGLCWSISNGFGFAILFDQDSVPGKGLVRDLFSFFELEIRKNNRLIAIGPTIFDETSGSEIPFVSFGFLRNSKFYSSEHQYGTVFYPDFLITSGTLICLSKLESVGLMREDLFIDNVDLEWCFRVKSLGYEIGGVAGIVLKHRLGEPVGGRSMQVFRNLQWHSPLRQYYITRNRILLYKSGYAPLAWIFRDCFRMIIKITVYIFFISPRSENLKMIVAGLVHGFRGVSGRLQTK